jgi:hypothetical protein
MHDCSWAEIKRLTAHRCFVLAMRCLFTNESLDSAIWSMGRLSTWQQTMKRTTRRSKITWESSYNMGSYSELLHFVIEHTISKFKIYKKNATRGLSQYRRPLIYLVLFTSQVRECMRRTAPSGAFAIYKDYWRKDSPTCLTK